MYVGKSRGICVFTSFQNLLVLWGACPRGYLQVIDGKGRELSRCPLFFPLYLAIGLLYAFLSFLPSFHFHHTPLNLHEHCTLSTGSSDIQVSAHHG